MSIVLIGSGNVATHIGVTFAQAGEKVAQVYSRNLAHAHLLADRIGAEPIADWNKISTVEKLYLISVTDASIHKVVEQMPMVNGVVAHTAASVPMEVLSRFPHRGVFYPFQTFTKEKELSFKEVPLLLEANSKATLELLHSLAVKISDKVQQSDESARKRLHIAAVFACNFVNHLYTLADELLMENGLSFEILEPLIRETTEKALSLKPKSAQTGPASRLDFNVMNLHLDNLPDGSLEHQLYQLLSQSIMQKVKSG